MKEEEAVDFFLGNGEKDYLAFLRVKHIHAFLKEDEEKRTKFEAWNLLCEIETCSHLRDPSSSLQKDEDEDAYFPQIVV